MQHDPPPPSPAIAPLRLPRKGKAMVNTCSSTVQPGREDWANTADDRQVRARMDDLFNHRVGLLCGLRCQSLDAVMTAYEAWRPALAAFYAASGQVQGAINLRNGDRLTDSDRLTIDGLRAAVGTLQQRIAA